MRSARAWCFFFSSRRRHTRCGRDWSSDVCSSDLPTRRLRVSSTGLAFSTARLTVVTGSLPVLRRHCSSAEYTTRSDSERLPLSMILFTSWVTSCDWYTGSGASGRRLTGPFRGMPLPLSPRSSALLGLGAVARAGLLAVADALRVEGAADDLVANARQVLHAAAAHQHDGVLLQVVAHAGDVRRDLDAAGQPHAADLAQRRVRLLGRGGVDARANAAALGRTLQRGRLGLGDLALPALTDQLGDRWHPISFAASRRRSSCSIQYHGTGRSITSWAVLDPPLVVVPGPRRSRPRARAGCCRSRGGPPPLLPH